MSVKHNLEQWIAQLDYEDTCDISDRQVSELIRNYDALEAKCAALAAENAALNDKMNRIATWPGIEFYSSAWEFCNLDGNDALEFMCDVKTPATDAFLAEVRASARNEGINYAAGRLSAAFNAGFVDKPLAEVCDVVRMILDAKEELANSTLPAADGISGEYAEKFLAEFAAKLRKGAKS